jgi:hypothetical protein
VRKGRQTVFDAPPEDLNEVALMSGRRHELPSLLSFLQTEQPRLRFILLRTLAGRECTLADRDDGFAGALDWLRANGWKVDEAAERSQKAPYVRSFVDR